MDREQLAKSLGTHLEGRYLPFTKEPVNERVQTLDIADAISLAFVVIDFLEEKNALKLSR